MSPKPGRSTLKELLQQFDERHWTWLKKRVLGYRVYSGLVRGNGRSVWVLRRDGDELFLRRGDKTGWVDASDLVVWAPKAGLAGNVER